MAGTSSLIREYVWMNGQVVAVLENGTTYYIRTDHIGRPVFATDSAGVKVWEASYLPFGGVHTSSGNTTNLRFPGQWFQSESGLHQNWMRDYDPVTGRYMQADPLGLVDGASVYGYAGQNPGRYIDPRGMQADVLDGPQSNIPGTGDSSDIGGGIGFGIRLFGGTAGAVVGGLIFPDQMADGTLGPDALADVLGESDMCPLPQEGFVPLDSLPPYVQSTPIDPTIGRHGGAASGGRKNTHRNKKGGKSSSDKHTKKGAGTRAC